MKCTCQYEKLINFIPSGVHNRNCDYFAYGRKIKKLTKINMKYWDNTQIIIGIALLGWLVLIIIY